MKRTFALIAVIFAVSLMAGCVARPKLNPGAEKVVVTASHPPSSCERISKLHGAYGDVVSGQFINTKHLQAGSVEKLKNAAHARGGNYVELVKDHGQLSGGFNYKYVNRIRVSGIAYLCPKKVLRHRHQG